MIPGVDKVTIVGHYDDAGRARSIFVYLNDESVSTQDVAAAIRAVFKPEMNSWNAVTAGDRGLPQVRLNGSDLFDRRV